MLDNYIRLVLLNDHIRLLLLNDHRIVSHAAGLGIIERSACSQTGCAANHGTNRSANHSTGNGSANQSVGL